MLPVSLVRGLVIDVPDTDDLCLRHLIMAMNIIYERAETNMRHKVNIYEMHARVMFTRLESLCALFLEPSAPIGDSHANIEPTEPVLPEVLSDLRQARSLFFGICRYRHSSLSRLEPWTITNPHFLRVRLLFLRWNELLSTYRARVASEDQAEFQRVSAMAFQASTLFPAYIYSIRTDLHALGRQLRPTEVRVVKPDKVSMVIEFPERYVHLVQGMADWNPDRGEDPLELGLWPSAELLSSSPERFVVNFGFY